MEVVLEVDGIRGFLYGLDVAEVGGAVDRFARCWYGLLPETAVDADEKELALPLAYGLLPLLVVTLLLMRGGVR